MLREREEEKALYLYMVEGILVHSLFDIIMLLELLQRNGEGEGRLIQVYPDLKVDRYLLTKCR